MKTETKIPDRAYFTQIANSAGRIIKSHFLYRQDIGTQWKADETPVTDADTRINEIVRFQIAKDFPDISFHGEEGERVVEGSEYRIFEDSVDGTAPFLAGLPVATFCMCLLKGNEPILAVIHEPFTGRMWTSKKGEGTFLDDRRICIPPGQSSLNRALLGICWWKTSGYGIRHMHEMVQQKGGKWFAVAAVAIYGGLIAQGTMHASIFPGHTGWETSAMQLMVEEAGGKATDIFGNPLTYGPNGEIKGHIISNGCLHDDLVRMAVECRCIEMIA